MTDAAPSSSASGILEAFLPQLPSQQHLPLACFALWRQKRSPLLSDRVALWYLFLAFALQEPWQQDALKLAVAESLHRSTPGLPAMAQILCAFCECPGGEDIAELPVARRR